MKPIRRSTLIAGAMAGGMFTFSYALTRLLSARGWKGPMSDHFDGRRFHNLPPTPDKSIADLLRWQLTASRGPWSWRDVAPFVPPERVDGQTLRVTLVNHSTTLIQTCGLNILTDPIWSERCSPFQWVGPRRFHPPGIRFEDLPPIDLVLVSHNHYDHLDLLTLRRLSRVHRPMIFAGLGNRDFLERWGVAGARDLDWWDSIEVTPELRLTAVPVRHWSTRTRQDLRNTLWLGFVLHTPGGNVYFPGDTGAGSHFAMARERFGGFRLALLPIGACLPRWFMKENHLDPADAAAAVDELGAEWAIPIHHSTFALGDDGQDYAVNVLRRLQRKEFIVLSAGHSVEVPAASSRGRSAPVPIR